MRRCKLAPSGQPNCSLALSERVQCTPVECGAPEASSGGGPTLGIKPDSPRPWQLVPLSISLSELLLRVKRPHTESRASESARSDGAAAQFRPGWRSKHCVPVPSSFLFILSQTSLLRIARHLASLSLRLPAMIKAFAKVRCAVLCHEIDACQRVAPSARPRADLAQGRGPADPA